VTQVNFSWFGEDITVDRHTDSLRAVITIAGGTGTGKSSTGALITENLKALGLQAITISTGIVFRLLAHLALEMSSQERAPKQFSAGELVSEAKHRETRFVGNAIFFGETEVPTATLKRSEVSRLVAFWGNEPMAAGYAKGLVRELANAFEGIIIIEGRSVGADYRNQTGPGRFHLVVSPDEAARRTNTPAADIAERDAADIRSGAMPTTDRGWVFDTTGLSPDLLAGEIMQWLFLICPAILTTPLSPPIQGPLK
jgi:cytidylate kinase